ncbi:MAG: glycosyltransferase family 4 protein [Candidatus Saganbacteria bacterium]|nr:glycosyltransferase family 4 protein [Candidatus Saganbacteria bacterium]
MGGAPNYVKEMSERFVRDGNEVTVYTTNAWDLEFLFFPDRKSIMISEENVNGVKVRRYPVRHLKPNNMLRKILGRLPSAGARFLFKFPSAIMPELWRDIIVSSRNYDLIHATPSPFYSLIYPAYVAARLWNIPFIVTPFIHTGIPRGDSQLAMHTTPDQIRILKASNLVIVQSEIEKQALVMRGIKNERIFILGMGVNPDDIKGGDPVRFRLKHRIATNEAIIIYVGMITYDKGAFHVLDAFRKLLECGLKTTLVMAGHPSIEFQQYYDSQPLMVRQYCILTENISGMDKMDLFEAADLLVLPSRADSYGIVFLEAWLAGKPVIGAFAGGVPEVIIDGKDGFLIPFGNAHMLAEYIITLLNNPELRRKMGNSGREKVLMNCTWERRYNQVRSWFDGLVKS